MESSEALRETILTMGREVDYLRTETTHANLLLTALDAVLCVEGEKDPFADVFRALMPIFEFSTAIVLVENDDLNDNGKKSLTCVAASEDIFLASEWQQTRQFRKVLSGRIISTVGNQGIGEWPSRFSKHYASEQPALIFPLAVRDHRGLVILLRKACQTGFDRTHVTMARKFSLLASHAFAARQASLNEAESQRLKELTEKLKLSEEALRHRANHDELTGLPNRVYIEEIVGKMIADSSKRYRIALAFIDLDEFKRINDLHGHIAGDTLLKEIALRLKSELRPSDAVGRISGDEFVVALNPVDQQHETAQAIERLQQRLQQPMEINGNHITPSASIGIAFYPAHGTDYETLRRHADIAMYRAKTHIKGGNAFFTLDLGRQANEKLSLEQSLKDAIHTHSFYCALQKKVDIRTDKLMGFEMLARWIDPNGDIRRPAEFLPYANELGLLDNITLCILDDLISRLPELDRMFGTDVKYSLNISPIQTSDINFMTRLAKQLDTVGGARFILELTEEALAAMEILESKVLPMLHAADIRLSIDDFGTGYSSLSKLAALTVDELKVDMSLITAIHERPRNQVILRAIESLGAALDISIVAEGIESCDENDYLLKNTVINIGQGFLYHQPQLLNHILTPPQQQAQHSKKH